MSQGVGTQECPGCHEWIGNDEAYCPFCDYDFGWFDPEEDFFEEEGEPADLSDEMYDDRPQDFFPEDEYEADRELDDCC